MTKENISRRPLASRDTKWAKSIAHWLIKSGLSPNQISVLSFVCAFMSGASLIGAGMTVQTTQALLFLAAAVCIQMRLLCNLFDGMVAIEGGFKTKSGEIYNELPDRLSDAVILASAGYALPATEWMHTMGWLAAILSIMTAYARALGGSAGASQHFTGPMAKPQRMAVMTVTCVIMTVLIFAGRPFNLIHPALCIISSGCVITIVRRIRLIVLDLEAK